MSDDLKIFESACVFMMPMLMHDFGFSGEDAAAIMGNFGHESDGGRQMQEKHPVAGRGGRGLGQWTASRRIAYEDWLRRNGTNDDTNWPIVYGFVFRELIGPEKKAVISVKAANGLDNKTKAFEQAYERAGVKHYPSRYTWANRALDIYNRHFRTSPSEPTLDERVAALEKRLQAVETLLNALASPQDLMT